jgi:hypothetical protein
MKEESGRVFRKHGVSQKDSWERLDIGSWLLNREVVGNECGALGTSSFLLRQVWEAVD